MIITRKRIKQAARLHSWRNLTEKYNIFLLHFYAYEDYTVLLTVARCEQMWSLHEEARKEELVHLAITGTYKKIFSHCENSGFICSLRRI